MHQVVQDQRGADDPAALSAIVPAAGAHQDDTRVPGMRVATPARPRRPEPTHRAGGQIAVIPAHGGAGASTLADWLRRELDGVPAGRGWHVGVTAALPDVDPAQIAASAR